MASWLVALGLLATPAGAEDLTGWIDGARSAYEGPKDLPIDFLDAIPAEYIDIEWDSSVGSGVFSLNTATGSRWIRLNPKLSVDGQGGGGVKPFAQLFRGHSGTIVHESFHAYMRWAKDQADDGWPKDPNADAAAVAAAATARRLVALQREVSCRYRTVLFEGEAAPRATTERQQWELAEESWTTWLSAVVSSWSVNATAIDDPADFRDAVLKDLRKLAAKGPAPYYVDGGEIYAKDRWVSAREQRFLMRHVLGLDEALVDEVFEGYGTDPAKPWDPKADESCVERSVLYVVDASGQHGRGRQDGPGPGGGPSVGDRRLRGRGARARSSGR